jgi:dienelactone hydrolase
MPRQTLTERWTQLQPHVRVYGPDDSRPRPTVLIFHGCGGAGGQVDTYAEVAAEAGYRAFVVDSYRPRGWSRAFGMTFVCSGLVFHGGERAGDVAASIHGVSARPEVDGRRLVLAGFSHGGWSIMELMVAPLERPGELGLADSHACDLDGVRGVFLGYPYIGPGAVRRTLPWRRQPRTFAIIAKRDHLTTVRNADRVLAAVEGSGVTVERWYAEAAHAFDEQNDLIPMKYDAALTAEALERFRSFLGSVFEGG